MKIGDLFYSLTIDDAGAKTTLTKELPQTADAGGQAAGKKFSAALTRTMSGSVGGAISPIGGRFDELGDRLVKRFHRRDIRELGGGISNSLLALATGGSVADVVGQAGLMMGIGLASSLIVSFVQKLAASSVIQALIPVLTTLGTAAGGILSTAIAVGAAALPFVLVGVLVAAIAFLIANPEIVGQIAAFAGDVIANIVNFLAGLPGALLGAFGPAFGAVVGAAPGFVLTLAGFILTLPFRIADLAVKMLEFFAGMFTTILAGIPGFIAGLVGFLFTIPGKLAALGGQMVGTIIDGLASLPGRVANAIADAFRNLKIDVGPFHIRGTGITIDLPKIDLGPNEANRGKTYAETHFPGHAAGAWSTREGLAYLHDREMVLPAPEAEAVRQGRVLGAQGVASATASGSTWAPTITINNPVPHAAEEDVGLELRRLAALGAAR
jgi:hypothetical protein